MYFSDKELGSVERSSEEITTPVWNGLVSIYESVISKNELSGNFSEQCPDGQGICGCDRSMLENSIRAEIPNIQTPINSVIESDFQQTESQVPDKYAVLDLIEFTHRNIQDCSTIGKYHDYHRHSHYQFSDNDQAKNDYREKVNKVFSRNGVVFYIDSDGAIKRTVPSSLKKIITDIRFSTNDQRLNELLEIAYSKFILPRIESRIESLEKVWDAFERLKTYFDENKKNSAATLVQEVAEGNSLFQSKIDDEFKALTNIGNNFQIRHFETNKVEIQSNLHVDYFFYRMSSLIHLCVESLKKG